jgi:hypothetical protein
VSLTGLAAVGAGFALFAPRSRSTLAFMRGVKTGLLLSALTAAFGLGAADAHADGADFFVFAGTGRGGDAQLHGDRGGSCQLCPAAAGAVVPDDLDDGEPRLAILSTGLVGTEGPFRGGGELSTILGLGGDHTTGFTAVVTYAGLDSGRLFVHGGLGVGRYWGGERAGGVADFAGTMRAELGLRLTDHWLIAGRADLLTNTISTSPVATIGIQWVPGAD